MISILTLFVGTIALGLCSFAEKVQPWPIKVERTGYCCSKLNIDFKTIGSYNASDVEQLQLCLKSQEIYMVRDSAMSIITFSSSGTGDFAIPDISEFAVYQRALVSAYAENNGYIYKHIGNRVDDPTFQGATDARWLKVKLLLDALNGWAQDTELILWIDADAVVLDFGLDLLGLGRQYPQADLLASADIRMGLINTGVLLLRNTPWMRRFLHQWWYGPHSVPGDALLDASSSSSGAAWRQVCDQDAFDRLYTHYTNTWAPGDPRVSEKVKVLPMDALNSHPPAMVHQRPESSVLHLMGEHTALRRELFRRAWGNVCAARSGGVLPLQLGLKREVLLSYARVIYGDTVQSLLTAQQKVVKREEAGELPLLSSLDTGDNDNVEQEERMLALVVQPLEELSRAAHHLCDALHHLHGVTSDGQYQEEEVQLRQDIFQLVLGRTEAVKSVISLLAEQANRTKEALNRREDDPSTGGNDFVLGLAQLLKKRQALLTVQAQLLKRAAEAGNDLFGAAADSDEKLQVAVMVLGILETLEAHVDERSKHVPMHMKALMHQNLGVLQHTLSLEKEPSEPSIAGTSASNNAAGSSVLAGDISAAHLREAYKHLKTSVALFDAMNKLPHSSSEDSSTLMEASRSLQLLAGVTCSLGRYVEGTRRWEQALLQARRSLKGIERGVRYDNLAVALYNAAVCHHSAGNAVIVEKLLSEALSIIGASAGEMSGEEIADQELPSSYLKRHVLDLRALNKGQLSQLSSADQKSKSTRERSKNGQTPEGLMRAIQDPVTGKVTYIRKEQDKTTDDDQGEEKEKEEDEWVECELDEACDEFEIEVEVAVEVAVEVGVPPVSAKPSSTALTRDIGGKQPTFHPEVIVEDQAILLLSEEDPLAGVDIEGMSAEDVAELREVRQRYARQQQRQQQQQSLVANDNNAMPSKKEQQQGTEDRRQSGTSSNPSSQAALAKVTAQLEHLTSMHTQQGLLIEQLLLEIRALRQQLQ